MASLLEPHKLRGLFTQYLSAMYKKEVPLYGTLCDIVSRVNNDEQPYNSDDITQERHGAIRLASGDELAIITRLFHLLGLEPVNYYNLTQAGLPVHSTAFRPIHNMELRQQPFRVFTSVIRPDFMHDSTLRRLYHDILKQRSIMQPSLQRLLTTFEDKGGVPHDDAPLFIELLSTIFAWHSHALVDYDTYQYIHNIHPILADIICFKGPHINHLTPRTVNIDKAHHAMIDANISCKHIIEGPPKRTCPILLRQTSFKAIKEHIYFNGHKASHTARFGEIEERGVALTPKGQALYDKAIATVQAYSHEPDYTQRLHDAFRIIPDNIETMRQQNLIYVQYTASPHDAHQATTATLSIEQAIAQGYITYTPITYEDFLPISATGIFKSNLHGSNTNHKSNPLHRDDQREEFEFYLNKPIYDSHILYNQQQEESRLSCII